MGFIFEVCLYNFVSVFRTGEASVDYTFRLSEKKINWDLTWAHTEKSLQRFGDNLTYGGYALTVTGVGAGAGLPLGTTGGVISFGGSMIESYYLGKLSTNGATSVGIRLIDSGTNVLIKRIPGAQWGKDILLQNKQIKLSLIEKAINN